MRTFGIALTSLLIGTLFASAASAWTGPTASPPNENVAAPINVGTVDQIKNAGIGVNSLAVFGNAILNGASRYLNFGPTVGSTGYGFRDNAGTMEFKDSGGSWRSFQAFVCSLVSCTGGGSIGPISQITFTDNTTQTTAPTSPTGSIGPISQITFTDGTNQATAATTTGGGGGTSFWAAIANHIYNTNTGNVGIGTTNPAAKLEVAGQVKITGGSPGAGKVLTSDASGLAFWLTPTSAGSIGPITQITFSDNTTQTTAPPSSVTVQYQTGMWCGLRGRACTIGGSPYFGQNISCSGTPITVTCEPCGDDTCVASINCPSGFTGVILAGTNGGPAPGNLYGTSGGYATCVKN